MLKNCLTSTLALATLLTYSQPTIDGSGADALYTTKASWTQANTGFGDYGISNLRTYEDGTYLYVMLTGSCETNTNEFYLFINSFSNSGGRAAGNALPNGSDSGSPFAGFNATLDFQVDFGLRLTNDMSQAYTSIINYAGSGNTDTYLGSIATNGTATTVSGGSYDGLRLAYNHTGSLSGSGNAGWEMRIPLSAIGAVAGDSFEFLAMYGNGDYISANTLPEIAGQSGTNLANDPNFSSIGGNQHSFFERATLQPIIDGQDDGDTQYLLKATWTEGNTGFGDYGMVALKAREDGHYLYVLVEGVVENKSSNYTEFYLFLNSSSESNGRSGGSQLPAGSDNGSPFTNARPTLDFEVDYGLRLTVGNSQGFASIIDYTSSGNTDTYLGTIGLNGTPITSYASGYEGTQVAYSHAGNLTSQTNEGWEMRIPLTAIGASAEDDFQLFGMYGDDNFISENTLPEISGLSANLGSNPDFTAISGDQFTAANTLPVELIDFGVKWKEDRVEIYWMTASELNNDHFLIQRSTDGGHFHTIGLRAGVGTTNHLTRYKWTDHHPLTGISYYRLAQVDHDGTTSYHKMTVLYSDFANTFVVWPNPVTDQLHVQVNGSANQETIQIFGLNGQLILEQLASGEVVDSLDVHSLDPGIYFLIINGNEKKAHRFLKK